MKITYKRDGNYFKPYDENGNLIPSSLVPHYDQPKGYKGYKHDGGRRGDDDDMDAYILHFLNTGERLTQSELNTVSGSKKRTKANNIRVAWENIEKGFDDEFTKVLKIDPIKYSENIKSPLGIGDTSKLTNDQLTALSQGGTLAYNDDGTIQVNENNQPIITPGTNVAPETSTTEPLNPYVQYMQRMQEDTVANELGLLQSQNLAQRQQAEIGSQQMMMQNAQFKDQLIEQIKTDRLSKLRNGMSQMQIANEELQFMVGNQMQNQQAVSQANQQLLGVTQQQAQLPYQAYLNAQQGITGGQGYANFAAGMAATDASSMDMQARLMQSQQPWLTYQQAWDRVSTQKSQTEQIQPPK